MPANCQVLRFIRRLTVTHLCRYIGVESPVMTLEACVLLEFWDSKLFSLEGKLSDMYAPGDEIFGLTRRSCEFF